MKKKIPLTILEALQPVADSNLELIKIMNDNDSIFHLIDKDENSDFFFKVSKQENRSNKIVYHTEYKPRNNEIINKYSSILTAEKVLTHIKNWLGLLQKYNDIQTIYDDPILKSNQERFEKKFEILDDDAYTTSFDLEQQIFLDEYLSNVKSKLLELQEGKNKDQIKELDELESEATEIQNNLTNETKRQIIKRLSKFWAKSQKIGLDVIKEIFVNVVAELTKRLLIGG